MKFNLKNYILYVLLFLVVNQNAYAVSEQQVKVAVLYNLLRMVEWPDETIQQKDQPFTLCFMGEEPFGDALHVIQKKRIQQRNFHFLKNIALGQIENCKVLFIANSEEQRLESIMTELQKYPILTVADTQGFAQRGVMINLIREKTKVVLELNEKSTLAVGLSLNPVLLRLVRVIDTNE